MNDAQRLLEIFEKIRSHVPDEPDEPVLVQEIVWKISCAGEELEDFIEYRYALAKLIEATEKDYLNLYLKRELTRENSLAFEIMKMIVNAAAIQDYAMDMYTALDNAFFVRLKNCVYSLPDENPMPYGKSQMDHHQLMFKRLTSLIQEVKESSIDFDTKNILLNLLHRAQTALSAYVEFGPTVFAETLRETAQCIQNTIPPSTVRAHAELFRNITQVLAQSSKDLWDITKNFSKIAATVGALYVIATKYPELGVEVGPLIYLLTEDSKALSVDDAPKLLECHIEENDIPRPD